MRRHDRQRLATLGAVATLAALLAVWAVGAVLALATGCHADPPPAPPGADPWGALVEAGCAAPDPTGDQAVAAELATDAAPPWLRCLADGGSVAGCDVPCDAAAARPGPRRLRGTRGGGW